MPDRGSDWNERARTVEELHRRFSGAIFDLSVRMLADRSQAEDAVQETFVNAFRSLDSFRYGTNPLPWLYRIATNVCLRLLRTRKRLQLDDRADRTAAATRDPVGKIHARRVLEQLVDELDERGQVILVSHYISGMDQGQIAEMLGISRRAVVKRLTALRKRLGHLFEEETGND